MKFNSVNDVQVMTHSPVLTPKAGDRSKSRRKGCEVADTNKTRQNESLSAPEGETPAGVEHEKSKGITYKLGTLGGYKE